MDILGRGPNRLVALPVDIKKLSSRKLETLDLKSELKSLELSGDLERVVAAKEGIDGVDRRRDVRDELVGLSRGTRELTLLELTIAEDCLRTLEIEVEVEVEVEVEEEEVEVGIEEGVEAVMVLVAWDPA